MGFNSAFKVLIRLPTYLWTYYHNIAYKLVSSFVSAHCLSSYLYLSVLCKWIPVLAAIRSYHLYRYGWLSRLTIS